MLSGDCWNPSRRIKAETWGWRWEGLCIESFLPHYRLYLGRNHPCGILVRGLFSSVPPLACVDALHWKSDLPGAPNLERILRDLEAGRTDGQTDRQTDTDADTHTHPLCHSHYGLQTRIIYDTALRKYSMPIKNVGT